MSLLLGFSCNDTRRRGYQEKTDDWDTVPTEEHVQIQNADTITPPDLQRHEAEEAPAPTASPSAAAPTVSRYYEEGYDNGYDDGEEDAIGDNGWRGNYDESSRYRGWKRQDYEEGYDEGYEAGYDDNFEGAEE